MNHRFVINACLVVVCRETTNRVLDTDTIRYRVRPMNALFVYIVRRRLCAAAHRRSVFGFAVTSVCATFPAGIGSRLRSSITFCFCAECRHVKSALLFHLSGICYDVGGSTKAKTFLLPQRERETRSIVYLFHLQSCLACERSSYYFANRTFRFLQTGRVSKRTVLGSDDWYS